MGEHWATSLSPFSVRRAASTEGQGNYRPLRGPVSPASPQVVQMLVPGAWLPCWRTEGQSRDPAAELPPSHPWLHSPLPGTLHFLLAGAQELILLLQQQGAHHHNGRRGRARVGGLCRGREECCQQLFQVGGAHLDKAPKDCGTKGWLSTIVWSSPKQTPPPSSRAPCGAEGRGDSTFADELRLHSTLLPRPQGGNDGPCSGVGHLQITVEAQGLSQVQEPTAH